ncbi:hypothetical protein FFLO_06238 [Filobasidium floriforme]|uniref:Uncharacterized protein n=1 Tax=Filobasidium floriforme TaxID=5210 RepID=A0A8K0JH48_9TREE|nr:hypothetical protein FFLO_06238 [Filobasidium floriforme]
MSSDEGKNMMDNFKQGENETPEESDYTPQQGGSGSNSFPSGEAQYGSNANTDNQYTAQNVNADAENQSSGAGNQNKAAGANAEGELQMGGVNKDKIKGASDYDGYEQGDSAASGGWGANRKGNSFSRENQLGAETNGPFTSDPNTNENAVDANRSGTSTPGYAEEDELDSGRRKTQGGGGSSGLNPYGDNEEDGPSNENNPYHEQGRRV